MSFNLPAFRQRLIFRGVFLLLIIATLFIALVLLTEEKERSYNNYQQTLQKTYAEIMARLRHPTGRVMLLNPQHNQHNKAPLSPLLIPYSAIDFTDKAKALQAVELTGCAAQYKDASTLCAAVGYNPYAGGFVYLVGNFSAGQLVGRPAKQRELDDVTRLVINIDMPNEKARWMLPFENHTKENQKYTWGRLPGYKTDEDRLTATSKPDGEFRGWLWQDENCIEASQNASCSKDTFFAIRVPVDHFRVTKERLAKSGWPPIPLDQVKIRLQAFAPYEATPLFDSNNNEVTLPPTLEGIAQILTPGEELLIHKEGSLKGTSLTSSIKLTRVSEWYEWLIRSLPTKSNLSTISFSDVISTPLGRYSIKLTGNTQTVDHILAVTSYSVAWYVAIMIMAIILAWITIEVGLIRPVVKLTKKAAKIANNIQKTTVSSNLDQFDFSALKGRDEVGILATALSNLLQRVKDDLQREAIRVQQERDMWHAVGHEIMSPLQSLMVLHHDKDSASYRYVKRMQQAIQVIYGTASPSEAFTEATLQLGFLDINEFLANIAANASFADINHVDFTPSVETLMVRADEFSLEDVVTHILRNADRYRVVDTAIQVHIESTSSTVQIHIYNQGERINPEIINNIFEYGVSDLSNDKNKSHRGQGLFVAKTYMAKMGGSIQVRNEEEGVTFILTLQRQ